MKRTKRLVFATNNAHKLEEARQIISDGFEIVSLAEIGCHDDIPETADTLEGNALIKARWVKDRYGFDCFADDTGLMVDALGGAPGVYSARYAGEHCSPSDNVAKLLDEMDGLSDRKAHFSTVIALVADGEEHCFEGSVAGSIATEPHGDGGFGYDPVFIAEETGRCFAEMSAEAKNSISHRGRAMRKLRDFLGCLMVLVILMLGVAPSSAEEWRLHASYDGQIERLIDTPKYTYFLGTAQNYVKGNQVAGTLHGVLFRYDKEGEEMTHLNSQNILSGNIVRAIDYNFERNYLVVAYDDGNIDLVYDTGKVVNIPGLKLADSSLDKTVNNINFDSANNRVWLATNFGYVVINDVLNEVETSRVFNVPLVGVFPFQDKLWLATEDAIYYGEPKEFDFSNFTKQGDCGNMIRIFPVNADEIYLLHGPKGSMYVNKISKVNGNYRRTGVSTVSEVGLEPMKNGFLIIGQRVMQVWDKEGNVTRHETLYDDRNSYVGTVDGSVFWISDGRKGISMKRAPRNESDKWTVLKNAFRPNASAAYTCGSMAYHPQYGMLVRNYGMNLVFNSGNSNYILTPDLLSAYRNMEWVPMAATYREPSMTGLDFYNPNSISIDPQNSDHVYCGSTRHGILRLDLANPEKSLHFSKPNDVLGGYGKAGFVPIMPATDPSIFWPERCAFAPPAFDNAGNLWTAYVNPDAREGSTFTELWIWTPQDRAATTATSASPFKKIKIEGLSSGNTPLVLPLTAAKNKNIVLSHGNLNSTPLVIYNHGGTIENTSDDTYAMMRVINDQDGSSVTFNGVFAIYEDQQTGLVWVSTGAGLFTFDPQEAMKDPSSVRRIKVPRNDGTNLADYLLEGVQVNSIINDASGRKWFGTNGGGLVCTSSDGRQIIKTYNEDNSDLASNYVYSVCHNPDTNSLMISTDRGLCELFLNGSASESGGTSDVRVYPNPVRPDYYGYVTIDGLPDNAMVKIADVAGNVIKECGMAESGEIRWDITNRYMKRVPGGVYLIIATNGPDSDSYAKVAKVLVVD